MLGKGYNFLPYTGAKDGNKLRNKNDPEGAWKPETAHWPGVLLGFDRSCRDIRGQQSCAWESSNYLLSSCKFNANQLSIQRQNYLEWSHICWPSSRERGTKWRLAYLPWSFRAFACVVGKVQFFLSTWICCWSPNELHCPDLSRADGWVMCPGTGHCWID